MSLLLKLTAAGGGGGATVNATLRNIFITDLAPSPSGGAIVSPGLRTTVITDLAPSPSAGAIVTSPATHSTFNTHYAVIVQTLGVAVDFMRTRRRRRS